ncbi:MAG: hypothetical protein AAFX93_12880 [Verrucomicrobiota bacterium]
MMLIPQTHFHSLIDEDKEWYSVQDVAAIIGRTDQYVRDCFDNGHLLGHRLVGRSRNGASGRRSYQVHRDGLVLYLLETANYEPEDFMERVASILSKRHPDEIQAIAEQAISTGRRRRRF